MKTEITSLELHFLVREFQKIKKAKIDQIYQERENFLFQLYDTKLGKLYLRIILPSLIYLSETKRKYKTDKFGLSLRKHINNSWIQKIEQVGFERILKFELSFKNSVYCLYVELFNPGNIILCNEGGKIVVAKEYKSFGSRVLRPNKDYKYPKTEFNFLEIDEHGLNKLLEGSEKNSIVITLAVNLGLGGLYAEELCAIAEIDKKKSSLEKKEIIRLYNAIKEIRGKKISPGTYYEKNSVLEIVPFPLKQYETKKFEEKQTFSKAISEYNNIRLRKEKKKEKKNKYDKEKEKIEGIIKTQTKQIQGLKKSHKSNKEKGEAIYENYTKLEEIISEIRKVSPKDVEKKIKDIKKVKEYDQKTKTITVDI